MGIDIQKQSFPTPSDFFDRIRKGEFAAVDEFHNLIGELMKNRQWEIAKQYQMHFSNLFYNSETALLDDVHQTAINAIKKVIKDENNCREICKVLAFYHATVTLKMHENRQTILQKEITIIDLIKKVLE